MSLEIIEHITQLKKDMLTEFEASRVKTVAEIKDYIAKEVDSKISNLEARINAQEREFRKRNLVIFGLDETAKEQLDERVCAFFSLKLDLNINPSEIDFIHRIGRNVDTKSRPVILGMVTFNRKLNILKNAHKLKGENVFITEDYPKEVADRRKLLHPQMIEARKAGKYAVIKYDKLIIKESRQESTNPSRKRMMSVSPQQQNRSTGESTKAHKKNKGEDMKQGTLLRYLLPRKDQPEKPVVGAASSGEGGVSEA